MIETSAVKYNGRRPASWRAAITTAGRCSAVPCVSWWA